MIEGEMTGEDQIGERERSRDKERGEKIERIP